MPLLYVGVALALVGYGGQLYLHVRRIQRERKARARAQLPTARIHERRDT